MGLQDRVFVLVQNESGHASGDTIMRFGDAELPFTAEYAGPNVMYGHVVVHEGRMLYHSLDSDGNLSAGIARVQLDDSLPTPEMTLEWRWLTGDDSSGTSVWRQLSE